MYHYPAFNQFEMYCDTWEQDIVLEAVFSKSV